MKAEHSRTALSHWDRAALSVSFLPCILNFINDCTSHNIAPIFRIISVFNEDTWQLLLDGLVEGNSCRTHITNYKLFLEFLEWVGGVKLLLPCPQLGWEKNKGKNYFGEEHS